MQYKLQSGMKLILECELFPYHVNSPLPVIPFHDSTLISLFTNTKLLGCSLVLANASVVCIMDGLVQLGKMVLSAFQLILSSGGSCRPSDGSPRPHANFLLFFYTLICHLSGQEAFFVGSLTRNLSPIWNNVLFSCLFILSL